MTRRKFQQLLAGAATFAGAGVRLAKAADPDYTIAVIPDSQYLAGNCASLPGGMTAYKKLIQRVVTDQGAWNIKAVVHVGDCSDWVGVGDGGQSQVTRAAYQLLNDAGIPFIGPPGNHDYDTTPGTRTNLSFNFRGGQLMGADTRATWFGAGRPLGNGDMAYWVGGYDSTGALPNSGANTAMRLQIGSRRLLIIALEFYPATGALAWAQTLHDEYQNQGYEVFVTTHGYLTDEIGGALISRSYGKYGPGVYGMGTAPNSNSGLEMWRGYMSSGGGTDPSSSGWGGFRLWPNLQAILCGHYVDPVHSALTGDMNHSLWTRIPVKSDSARKQTVQQIFCNLQNLDYIGTPNEGGYTVANYCPGNVLDGVSDTMHLFYLTFRPSQGTVEGALLSVNTGLWATGMGSAIPICTSATSVNLFGNLSYSVPPRHMFPMPSPVKRR